MRAALVGVDFGQGDFAASVEELMLLARSAVAVRRAERRLPTPIDAYGAESPGEFFAVASEAFFQAPHTLLAAYPAVYEQMRQFYRQDPAARSRAHG